MQVSNFVTIYEYLQQLGFRVAAGKQADRATEIKDISTMKDVKRKK